MATYDPYDAQGHIEIPEQKPHRVTVQFPPRPVPREVEIWLTQQGWHVNSINGTTYFRHPEKWDGLYYEWWEAVTLENLSVISLGNVGIRRNILEAKEAMQDMEQVPPTG